MSQLITRVDEELLLAVDELVADGFVESRSDAVRRGLRELIDRRRRELIGRAIVAGYAREPQTEDELGWADEATVAMIEDEPW
jgi:Arc/MetJ-type ribon-helix-helix transcriptional regulator